MKVLLLFHLDVTGLAIGSNTVLVISGDADSYGDTTGCTRPDNTETVSGHSRIAVPS